VYNKKKKKTSTQWHTTYRIMSTTKKDAFDIKCCECDVTRLFLTQKTRYMPHNVHCMLTFEDQERMHAI